MVENVFNFMKEFEKLTREQKDFFLRLTYFLLEDIDQVKKIDFALEKAKNYKQKVID